MFTEVKTGSNIFLSGAEVLVNPVNCHGVMGKGLALQFKNRFPVEYFSAYQSDCRQGRMKPGGITTWKNPVGSPKYIVNVATKNSWRDDSQYSWIQSGMIDLRTWAEKNGISSIAVPALGAGLGNLDEDRVHSIVKSTFLNSEVDILWHAKFELLSSPSLKSSVVSTPVQQTLTDVDVYPGFVKRESHGYVVYDAPGVTIIPNLLTKMDSEILLQEIDSAAKDMPFVRPKMPKSGTDFKYVMACFGPKIWKADISGYRYEDSKLLDGSSAYVPNAVNDAAGLALYAAGLKYGERPQMQTFLVNKYDGPTSTLGMHRDQDEINKKAPIASVSLGGSCVFSFKDPQSGEVKKIPLAHGTGLIMHGPGRMAYHSVDAVQGSRLNITARQVLNERIEVIHRGPRLPSVEKVLEERKLAKSTSGKVPSASVKESTVIALDVGNSLHYRGNKESLDKNNAMYVGRVSWPGKELEVPRLWGLRNQFKVLPGQPNDVAIDPFEKSLRFSLLNDQESLNALARQYPDFDASSGPQIVRDFNTLVDLTEKKDKMILLCHCRPAACHGEIIGAYISIELERRGRTVGLPSYIQSVRDNLADIPQVLDKVAAQSRGKSR